MAPPGPPIHPLHDAGTSQKHMRFQKELSLRLLKCVLHLDSALEQILI